MSNTKLVPLGKNGPLVPHLGFGLMGLSYETYGSVPSDEERFVILDKAYELGCRFWDSSDLYGDSEELLNKWFKRTGKRDEIFLATKFGFLKGVKGFAIDSSGDYAKKACDESLRILGVDCIDLYYMHHANPVTPIEETMRAMKELQDAGKIKHIGLSAISSATLRRAVKIAPVAAVQVDYSPFVLDIEGPAGTDLLATCRELGVALVAAMPLNRGVLTASYASKGAEGVSEGDAKDMRVKVMPRFLAENVDANIKLVNEFQALGEKYGCTIPQLALAWLLKQGDDVIPIPGTKKLHYLQENWKALDVELSGEAEKEVRLFVESASTKLAGDPLPAMFKGYNFRDTEEEVVV